MVFFRRGAPTDDPWLTEKLWVFTVGAAAALAGMLLDQSWLLAAGALLLAAGIALRFLPRPGRDEPGEQDAPDEVDEVSEPGEPGEPGEPDEPDERNAP